MSNLMQMLCLTVVGVVVFQATVGIAHPVRWETVNELGIGPVDSNYVTYRIVSFGHYAEQQIKAALKVWWKHIPMKFLEKRVGPVDIEFKFVAGRHPDDSIPFDGPGRTATHIGVLKKGEVKLIHFDSEDQWRLPWRQNKIGYSIMRTAVHEIGHALGLTHSDHKNSVMHPDFDVSKDEEVKLDTDDLRKLLRLYGIRNITTYRVKNYPSKMEQDVVLREIQDAFKAWQIYINLDLMEDTDGTADIEFDFVKGFEPASTDAHDQAAVMTAPGKIFLNDDLDWQTARSEGEGPSLRRVAAHQIGHALGLDDTETPEALMFKDYDQSDNGPIFLQAEDYLRAEEIYGMRTKPIPVEINFSTL